MAETLTPEVPWLGVVIWAMAALCGAYLWVLLSTYTEVNPSGLKLRTPAKVQVVAWHELAEVRWHRTHTVDILLLCTDDGRQIKAPAAIVIDTGLGEKRMLRLLADIEAAWSVAPVTTPS